MTQVKKVWDWRDAVRQSSLEPTTKLVLYTIGLYMNSLGQGAWPTYKTLAKDTGLSRRQVIRKMDEAVKAGFISKERARRADGGWTSNRYHCRFPEGTVVVGAGAMGVTSPSDISVTPPGDMGVTTMITPVINSNTPLSPLPPDDLTESQAAPFWTAGKENTPSHQDAAAVALKAAQDCLASLPHCVKALRDGRHPVISHEGKNDARLMRDRLKEALQSSQLDELCNLVVSLRAGYFARPDMAKLVKEFHDHGWQVSLSGIPAWAVAEGFRLYRTDGHTRKPLATQIAQQAQAALKPYNTALFACERYINAPMPQPVRAMSPEEKAAEVKAVSQIVESIRTETLNNKTGI